MTISEESTKVQVQDLAFSVTSGVETLDQINTQGFLIEKTFFQYQEHAFREATTTRTCSLVKSFPVTRCGLRNLCGVLVMVPESDSCDTDATYPDGGEREAIQT